MSRLLGLFGAAQRFTHNVPGDGCRHLGAAAAMLDHHGNRIARRIDRRVGQEQGMVALDPGPFCILDDTASTLTQGDAANLAGSGFTGEKPALFLNPRPVGRASRRIGNGEHAPADHVQRRFGHPQARQLGMGQAFGERGRVFHIIAPIANCRGGWRRFKQVRRHRQPAIGDSCHHHRELQGRGQHETLANAGYQGFATLPTLAHNGELPLPGRHQAWFLTRQVDANPRAQAETLGHGGDPVDSGAPRQVIKIDIATLLDGTV